MQRNGAEDRAKSPEEGEEGKAAIFCYLFDTYHGFRPFVRLARASGIWHRSRRQGRHAFYEETQKRRLNDGRDEGT